MNETPQITSATVNYLIVTSLNGLASIIYHHEREPIHFPPSVAPDDLSQDFDVHLLEKILHKIAHGGDVTCDELSKVLGFVADMMTEDSD